MTNKSVTAIKNETLGEDEGDENNTEGNHTMSRTAMRISLHKDPMYMLYIKDPKLEYMQDPTVMRISLHRDPMYML